MPRFRPGLVPSLATAFAVGVLCTLGAWQVRRLHWRQADLAAKNAQIEREPLALADALADPAAHAYRRVIARGSYDRAQSIVVSPVSRGLEEGARVLTPLLIPGPSRAGVAVIVDRGWVPSSQLDAFLAADLAKGPLPAEVTGLAFLLDVGDAVPGMRDLASRRVRWAHFDPSRQAQVQALQAQVPYRLAPLLLQAQAEGTTEIPLGGFERPTSPVDHRSYAITWFGMAAVALATWVGLGFKQGRERGAEELRGVHPPGKVA
ncbi:MAG TPA: SURF1 family protein [Myxococcota bacterium]|nr:SURF1 family protein [Myxococcota bacterium]